jgi:hypothetical protein
VKCEVPGALPAGGASFTLGGTPISGIAVSGTAAFTVGPNTGLSAGTHTATVSFTVIPVYNLISVPAGEVSATNTGSGHTLNWGVGRGGTEHTPV